MNPGSAHNSGRLKRRLAVLLLCLFSSGVAALWGLVQAHAAHGIILDYQAAYIGARCVVQHRDPYNESDAMGVYLAEGGLRVPQSRSGQSTLYMAALQVYPPTAELFFVPFAMLPWRTAYGLWTCLTLSLMTLAAFLMWDVGHIYSPDLPFYLACIVLANSGVLFAGGNPAGFAVSLCIISVWCFLEHRFQMVGVLCMATSLAIKPHDAGLIWLWLLLLGGLFRKRAIQSLAVVTGLGIVAATWISQVSPLWIQELRSNLAAVATNGAYSDPTGITAPMMVNLQTVIAVFRNEPRFYNAVTWATCGVLLLIWTFVTLRSRRTPKEIWLGLAAISTLSLLPLYHRPHDAKILLLTLPACAALWAERGLMAWMSVAFTSAEILVTSDLPMALLSMHQSALAIKPGIEGELLWILTNRDAPVVLLAGSIFYVWAYARCSRKERSASAVMPTFETGESVH